VSGRLGLHFAKSAVNLLDHHSVSAFISAVLPMRPVLVVVDTLARCMVGGDEDSAQDMGRFVSSLETLRSELGAAVLVLHHPTKTNRGERGSGALRGAVDTVIKASSAGGAIVLECEKQKDAEPFSDIRVRLEMVTLADGRCSCVITEAVANSPGTQSPASSISPTELRVLRTLRDAPNSTMTRGAVVVACQWLAARSVDRALVGLVALGYCEKGKKGLYAVAAAGLAIANQSP